MYRVPQPLPNVWDTQNSVNVIGAVSLGTPAGRVYPEVFPRTPQLYENTPQAFESTPRVFENTSRPFGNTLQPPENTLQPSVNMAEAALQRASIGRKGLQEHTKIHGSQVNGIRKSTPLKPPVHKKLANLITPERVSPGLGKTRPQEPHMPGPEQRAPLNEPIPPCDLKEPTPIPPPPPFTNILERNGCIRWETDLARHLYSSNVMGLYKIGDWLCDVHAPSGKIVRVAKRDVTPDGKLFWRHHITKQRVHSTGGDGLNGKVAYLSNGAFLWMENSGGSRIRPKWQFADPVDLNSDPKELKIGRFAVKEETPIIIGLKSGYDPMWF
ncbi:hypothetical protein N0V84_001591 [Fusarium piperis]|uniref:Uncharacterized protein n=1 Tax=Fusarium piperis TaxID=1435070 RepID=A0A9W9BSD5_9HYPO|nr:hypothetical protein N0V84_001591 [Fusarium piperis]